MLGALFEIRMTFQMPTAKPRNSITSISHGFVPNHRSISQPDDSAPKGTTNELTQDQLARLIAGIRLPLGGPFRFRLLHPVEPLIEQFQPCVWWKLRDLVDLVLSHASPLCVAPQQFTAGQPGTRNMAESDTAKARPLYERGGG